MSNQRYIIHGISLPLFLCHFVASNMSTCAHVPFGLWNDVSHNSCCILRESDKFWKEKKKKGIREQYLKCRWVITIPLT